MSERQSMAATELVSTVDARINCVTSSMWASVTVGWFALSPAIGFA